MKKIKTLSKAFSAIGIAILLISPEATARSFYFDASLGIGMGNSTLSTDTDSPLVGLTTIGATIGISAWKDVAIFGITSDYRWITQLNNPPSNVGNRRGSYFNIISPTVGLRIHRMLFKADIKFLGSYSFLNPSISGDTIAYGSPFGYRLQVIYVKKHNPWYGVGAFYESTTFGKEEVNGQTLASGPLTLWQAGVMVTFLLDYKARQDLADRFNIGKKGG